MTGQRAFRQFAAFLFAFRLVTSTAGDAAPPPPGFVEAYRAQFCGPVPAAIPIDMQVRAVSADKAGVRIPSSSPISFAWAIDIDLPKDVKPVGITVAFNQGTLLLSADGRWIRIAQPKTPIGGEAQSFPIGDGTRPTAVTAEADGGAATIQQDGSTIAQYDLAACGFGAKARTAFRLADGARADVIAQVAPYIAGFSGNRYILVAGHQAGKPGQLGFWPVSDGNVAKSFEAPFVPIPDGQNLVLLSEFDIVGGCNAVYGTKSRDGPTTLSTFCKPGFSDDTTLLAGDVGLPVRRTPAGVRAPIGLAAFSDPLLGATEYPWRENGHVMLLVLAKARSGATRVIALSGRPADYPQARR